MTGQGVGRAELDAAAAPDGGGPTQDDVPSAVVEIRAVNHRYLDVRVRCPPELAEHQGAVEHKVRRALLRGRVDVSLRLEGRAAGLPVLDRAAARAAYAQLAALRDELRPDEPVPLSLLATVPELWSGSAAAHPEAARRALEAATDRACAAVAQMRRVEGEALAADLARHLDALERAADAVRARTPEVVRATRDKLATRLAQLLEESAARLDDARLAQEVALLADRADVSEELSRLASHVVQARGLLCEESGEGGEATRGKRLDFLLQEMSREANTIGSKSADASLAHAVVEMKTAISRMREQAQNVL